ncbi:MAG TPA: MMPL family transporter [Mycobacteriales bacterium]|nr:MMPL family transporter [Mycobacteriales bacterium]
MFEALGRAAFRRRWAVLVAAVAFLLVGGLWGTGVFASLTSGGFDDPGSDSSRAAAVAAAELGRDDADVVVLYRSADRTVDDPAVRQAVTGTLAALPADAVARTVDWYGTRAPGLVSADRHATYAVLTLQGDEQQRTDVLNRIEPDLAAPGLDTTVSGTTTVGRDINERVSADLVRAETLSMPILLVLLVLVFGSLVAASLPVAIGALAILGAFTALRVVSLFTEVSIFSVNVVTILGMGLAIDYGLFVVGRYREELAGGLEPRAALVRTMATAGRTVAVSGLTVAAALAGLLIFPQVFLRSMGLGGIAAVLIAVAAALTVLPALLAVLGRRVDALPVRRRRTAAPATATGAWDRLARSVMRRPVLYATAVVGVLLTLGLPFLRVSFGGIDARALPAATESRQVTETLNRDFPANATTPIQAVVSLPAGAGPGDLNAWVGEARTVPGITSATVTDRRDRTARVDLAFAGDPMSAQSRALVDRVRALPPPPGGSVLVGGQTATLADLLSSLGRLLPWMGLIVAGVTVLLLFLAFGSIVLPIKALLMNALSLTASFGAIVWIFQDGHLSGLLDFTSTGTLEATQPILVLAIVFGLSMDYEVFLMSRIRERYLATGDNTESVATGLQRTGGLITTAALLLVVVIGAFSLSGITFIKLIGVAMAIAVIVDATVVRALLVPASMRLLGRWNWWAPTPLRRFQDRFGLHEEADFSPGRNGGDGTLGRRDEAAGNRPDVAEVVQ